MRNNHTVFSQVFPKIRRSSLTHNFFFILLFSLCFFPLNAQAGEVTLAWDPPSTGYEGFILSYGTSSGSYNYNHDIGIKTTHTVKDLNEGQTYYFAVKAYFANHTEESAYSNQVHTTVSAQDTKAPAPPKGIEIIPGG